MNYEFNTIHLEPVSKCNLKCCHCRLQLDEYDAKNNIMDFDKIQLFLEEANPNKRRISLNLQGTGEASLHPQFEQIIEVASMNNYKVITTSNLLARKKDEYKKYLDNGLSQITVSIDTFNEELINRTRNGTNIRKLKETLSFLSKYYPDKINVYTVISDITILYIDEIFNFLQINKINNWRFIYLNNWDGTEGISNKNINVLKGKVREWEQTMRIFLPNKENEGYCRQPFDILHINALGYIMPCCLYEDNKVINFGNIFDTNENILNQFNSKSFNSFREKMQSGIADICKSCSLFKKYPVIEKK